MRLFTRGEIGLPIVVDPKRFDGHPSVGCLEPRRGGLRTIETGDAGEPEVIESRTARLAD